MKVLRWIHTFLFFTWMWLLLFLSIALLIPMFLFRLLRMRNAEKGYVYGLTKFWARQHNATAGARVQVVGKENIPDEGAFCIIGNHQGSMDIPILMAYIPRTLGFIAKAELKKVPFISSWMKAIGCVFIDRKNLRAAIDALRAAAAQVNAGHTMVLFPEGTRSRSGEPGKFNSAGIRMLVENQATILPVTLVNTRAIFEKDKLITPAKAKLYIHPPQRFKPEEASEAVGILREMVVGPLKSE
jgi:1-acyl-sn-glycerol-3-phosphate acyltransferase